MERIYPLHSVMLKLQVIHKRWSEILLRIFATTCIFIFTASSVGSTHIVGGDLTFECLGNNVYEFTLTMRRDCIYGDEEAQFDDPASLGFFDQFGNPLRQFGVFGQILIPFEKADTVYSVAQFECGFIGSSVCIQETVYKGKVLLNDIGSDIIVAYQRCCRNVTINNIVSPEATGATYFVRMEQESMTACNSSPVFVEWPEVFICSNQIWNVNHSAIDKENDSLVYRLVTPRSGADFDVPRPQPPNRPPFGYVEWVEGFGAQNFFGNNSMTMDSTSGNISALPGEQGQYLIGVAVDEYRDGKLLSTVSRDFEVNVGVCFDPPIAEFNFEVPDCAETTISFQNQSEFATSYRWFFDYPNEDSLFQSVDPSPSFNFPASGEYLVRLEAHTSFGNETCFDFIEKTILVEKEVISTDFTYELINCKDDSMTVLFTDRSISSITDNSIISWNWAITSSTYSNASSDQNPVFILPVNEELEVMLSVVSDSGCRADTISQVIFDQNANGQIEFEILSCSDSTIFVELYEATILPDSISKDSYQWDIDLNGNSMSLQTPTVILELPSKTKLGVSVSSSLTTGCTISAIDSFEFDFEELFNYKFYLEECSSEDTQKIKLISSSEGILDAGWLEVNWEISNGDQTTSFLGDSIEFENDNYKDITVQVTWTLDSNCEFTRIFELPNSKIFGEELKVSYEIENCVTDSVTILLTDTSIVQEEGLSSSFINRSWEVYIGTETIESSDSSFQISLPLLDTIHFSLMHSYANGCTNKYSQSIYIDAPSIESSQDTFFLCGTDGIQIISNPNSDWDYTWTPETGLSFTDSLDKSNPIANPMQSTDYHVQVSNGSCIVEKDIVIIRYKEQNLEVSGNLTLCDTTTSLNVSGGGSGAIYQWSLSESFSDVVLQGNHYDLPLEQDSVQLFVRALLDSCFSTIQTVVLIKDSVALEFIDSVIYVCSGSPMPLIANPNSDWLYVWEEEDGLVFSDPTDKSDPLAIPDQTRTYKVTVTNGTCEVNGEVQVVVIDEIELEISATVEDCSLSTSFQVSGAPEQAEYQWSFDSLFTEILDSGVQITIVIPDGAEKFYVRAMIPNCDAIVGSVELEGISYPGVAFIDDPIVICTEEGTHLVSNPNSEWSYQWTPTTGLDFSGNGASDPIARPDTTTLYNVLVDTGECSFEDSVLVIPTDEVNLQFRGNTAICDQQVELRVEGPGDPEFLWSEHALFTDTLVVGDSLIYVQSDSVKTYYVKALYENTCESRVEHVTVSHASVEIQFFADQLISCQDDPVFLIANPNSEWTYKWEPENGLIFPDGDRSNPMALPESNTEYRLTVSNGFCEDTGVVRVLRTEELEILILGDTIKCDGEVDLSASGLPETYNYQWSDTEHFENLLSEGPDFNTTFNGIDFTYFVRGVSGNCFTGPKSITVQDFTPIIDWVADTLVVCADSGIRLLNNPDPNLEYIWEPEEGLIFEDGDKSNPIALPNVTTEYTLVVKNDSCSSNIEKILVQRIEDVQLEIVQDTVDCDGHQYFSVTGENHTANYEWSVNENFFEVIGTKETIEATLSSGDTIFVRVKNGECYSEPARFIITTSELNLNLITNPIKVCSGTPIKILSDPDSSWTYTWEPSTDLDFNEGLHNPTYIGLSSATIGVTVTDGFCTLQDQIQVISFDEINLEIIAMVEDCSLPTKFQVTGAPENTNYQWSFDSLFAEVIDSGQQLSILPPEGFEKLYVRAIDPECGTIVGSIALQDISNPGVEFIDNPIILCDEDGTHLIANPNSDWSYQWMPSTGLDFSENGESDPVAKPDTTTMYKVIVDNGICIVEDSVLVIPADEANLQFRGRTAICDQSVQLSINGPGNPDYLWSGNAMFTDTLTMGDTLNYTQMDSVKTYYVKAKYANGCESRVEHITVNHAWVDIQFYHDQFISCEGNAAALVANPNPEWTYIWEPEEGLIFQNGDRSNPMALPEAKTEYNVTVTNGFCEEMGTVEVLRAEELEIKIEGDTLNCDGQVFLSASGLPVDYVYQWSDSEIFDSILFEGSGFEHIFTGEFFTYFLRGKSEACETAGSAIRVINSTPIVELIADTVIVCDGQGVRLLENPDPELEYIWMPEEGLIFEDGDRSNPIALPMESTEYSLTIRNDSCSTEVQKIFVQLLEDIQIEISLDSMDCSGVSYFSASGGGETATYQWSVSEDFLEIIDTVNTTQLSIAKGDTIFVRAIYGTCISAYSSFVMDKNELNLEVFSDPIIVCSGIPAKLLSNADSSWIYTWEPNADLDFSDGIHNPSFVGLTSTTIQVTVSNGSCMLTDSIDVIVTESVETMISGEEMTCDGTIYLTAETMGGLSIIWSESPGFETIIHISNYLDTIIEGNSKTYYAKALMVGTSCEATVDSFTVQNNSLQFTSTSSTELCQGDVLSFNLEPLNKLHEFDIQWNEDPHIVSGLDSTQIEVVALTSQDTFELSYTASNQFGCTTSDVIQFVPGSPNIYPNISTDIGCSDYLVCFDLNNISGEVQWDFGDGTSTTDQSFEHQVCYSYPGPGTYMVNLESIQPICGFKDTSFVLVLEQQLEINALKDTVQYCFGQDLSLSVQTNGDPGTIIWQNALGAEIGSGPSILFMPEMEFVQAIIALPGGCSDTAQIQMQSYDFNLSFTPLEAVCEGEPTELEVIDLADDSLLYQWGPADIILSGGNTNKPTIWSTNSQDVFLTITNADNQCEEVIAVPFDIVTIDIELSVDPDTMINLGETVIINSQVISETPVEFQWSNGKSEPELVLTPEESQTYTVVVTDESGCSATDQITISVQQPLCNEFDVFLPKAFTPNNDGVNDVLFVRSNFVQSMELLIFNRWGEQVFRTTDINEGWNGTFRNQGTDLAPDVYAFSLNVICINGLEYHTKGNITLLR